jgi:hypothetical protein
MTTHNWRADTLQDAVAGITPIDLALHLVGARGGHLTEARQAITDAQAAYQAGDTTTATQTALNLAEELQRARAPKGAAA